jgi:DNA-binding CsgD family transcriptional regulator
LEIKKLISKKDYHALFGIIDNSFLCNSDENYIELVEQFKKLIPFDSSLSALVNLRLFSYEDMVNKTINSGYPLEYLKIYTENKYHLKDPSWQKFYETSDIQNSNDLVGVYNYRPENPVFRLREEFGINNEFFYGLGNHDLGFFTLIGIYGNQVKDDKRTRLIIKYLVPFLLARLINIVPHNGKSGTTILTSTEIEILKWIKEGKSSWEISMILNRSESCINFHTTNILKKLDASNRTHAVVLAIEKSLIDI